MQTGSTPHRQTPPPASSGTASRPSPVLERIEGRVESVTDSGLRLSGQWYEWPPGWASERPTVGHVVRLHYRTRLVVQAIEPLNRSDNHQAAPSRTVSRPSATLPSSQASHGNGAERAKPDRSKTGTSNSRTVVRGTIESANDRGVKLAGTWYNFSRLTPLADDARQALVRGAMVRLTIENQRWIADAVIETPCDDVTGDAGHVQDDSYDEHYL